MPDPLATPDANSNTERGTVTVNGEPRPWHPGLSVAEALAREGLTPDAVATALNGHFIARPTRPTTLLQPGDQLTLFQAIVGG